MRGCQHTLNMDKLKPLENELMSHPKTRLVIGLLVALLLGACGTQQTYQGNILQGSGVLKPESREVSDFHAVELATVGTLIIEQGDSESLTLEVEDNLLPVFTTDVNDGVLVIDIKPGSSINSTLPILFHLTARDLDAITVGAAGNAEAAQLSADTLNITVTNSGSLKFDTVTANTLEISVRDNGALELGSVGSGEMTLNISGAGRSTIEAIETERLEVEITDAGEATLGGSATEQQVELSGSAGYQASDLVCETATITSGGASSAYVNVLNVLNATVTESGTIFYAGQPELNASAESAGEITALE